MIIKHTNLAYTFLHIVACCCLNSFTQAYTTNFEWTDLGTPENSTNSVISVLGVENLSLLLCENEINLENLNQLSEAQKIYLNFDPEVWGHCILVKFEADYAEISYRNVLKLIHQRIDWLNRESKFNVTLFIFYRNLIK